MRGRPFSPVTRAKTNAERRAALEAKRRAAGLCVRCAQPSGGKYQCDHCQKKWNARWRKRYYSNAYYDRYEVPRDPNKRPKGIRKAPFRWGPEAVYD